MPWRRDRLPTPVLLLGGLHEPHGQGGLGSTVRGQGALEGSHEPHGWGGLGAYVNPMDRGAWGLQSVDRGPGALRGVAESRTRLSTVIEETPAQHPMSVLKKRFTSEILIKPLPKLFNDWRSTFGIFIPCRPLQSSECHVRVICSGCTPPLPSKTKLLKHCFQGAKN